MKTWNLVLLAALLHVWSFAAIAQESGYACNGVVVWHATRQPVSRALVTISSVTSGSPEAMFLTGSDGRFAFAGLAAGKYQLAVEREGFRRQLFQGDTAGYSTAIVLGPGLTAEGIVFAVHAPATLSGTITDENGDPVRGQVFLFEKGVFDGKNGYQNRASIQTNSRGNFEFESLAAASYIVAVTARPWWNTMGGPRYQRTPSDQANTRADRDMGYPITYYGGTTDPNAAAPIVLSEGGHAKIQINMRAQPTVPVSIKNEATAPEGSSGARPSGRSEIGASFSGVGPGGFLIPVETATSMRDNDWIAAVVPGRYRMELQRFGQSKAEQLGSRTIDVQGETVIDTAAPAKVSVSGHIVLEGSALPDSPMSLLLTSGGAGHGALATPKQDGIFSFDNPPGPGSYQIRLSDAPGFYIKSVAATGAKYEEGRLEISEGANVDLTITAGSGTAKVTGVAFQNGRPFAGALVLLMPQSMQNSDTIYRDQSDADGSFTFTNVPPGHYVLLAVDDGKNFAYRDPKVIKPYLAHGDTVEVTAQMTPLKAAVQSRNK